MRWRRNRTNDWDRDQPRDQLLETLRKQGITDDGVLAAMAEVPRDAFVPESQKASAWENRALAIGESQTISQPYVVAIMTQALNLSGEERVLEIGSGSGYQAAILALLAKEVISIERIPSLAQRARKTLDQLGVANVVVIDGDGSAGLPDKSPFDRIIVTAGSPSVPAHLLEQLDRDGGVMVIPVGHSEYQRLIAIERTGEQYSRTDLGGVSFVPLIGEEGWSSEHSPRWE